MGLVLAAVVLGTLLPFEGVMTILWFLLLKVLEIIVLGVVPWTVGHFIGKDNWGPDTGLKWLDGMVALIIFIGLPFGVCFILYLFIVYNWRWATELAR